LWYDEQAWASSGKRTKSREEKGSRKRMNGAEDQGWGKGEWDKRGIRYVRLAHLGLLLISLGIVQLGPQPVYFLRESGATVHLTRLLLAPVGVKGEEGGRTGGRGRRGKEVREIDLMTI